MKLNYNKKSFLRSLIYFIAIVFASSCTIYKDVHDDDGIYSSETDGYRVITANSKEHRDYENNYFTQELERIDRIYGTDIVTDIETYNSINDNDTILNSTDNTSDFNSNRAWGYRDSDDVVININLNNTGFGWNNYFNHWNLNYLYSGFGNFNPWGPRLWGLGWRNGWGSRYYWGGYGFINNPYYSTPFSPYYYGRPGFGFLGWRNYYSHGYAHHRLGNLGNYTYGRRANYYSAYNRNGTNRISRRATASTNRRVNFTNGRRNNRPVRDIDLNNLASNLRIDKDKIKVYNKPDNVPSRDRRVGSTIDKNSNRRSSSTETRAYYKSRNTNSRSTSLQRNPSVRRTSPSRSMNMSRSRSSSIQRSSPSRSSSRRSSSLRR